MKNFENRVAAITGAGSGIGRALCLRLAAQGCHLAASDINDAGLAETADKVRAQSPGIRITTATLDVSDRAAVHAWADAVVAEHGRVNLIFNNAGVAHGATIESASYEDFEWIMGINFWGVVHGTKAFLPHLRASGEGHVVNISSVFGLISVPTQGTYNATKFAVRGFTEALRQELDIEDAPVSATSVHPGGIKTSIAASARFDASASQITGQSQEVSKRNFEKMFRTTADRAAEVILDGVKRNRRRVLIGGDARLIDLMQRLMPTGYQALLESAARRQRRRA